MVEHRALTRALKDPALGQIIGVHEFDPSPAIKNVGRPISVVSCFSDRSRQVSTVYPSIVVLIQNSYLLGFVQQLATGWLLHTHRKNFDLSRFVQGLAKKLVGEQIYRRSPSSIGRVLILESVLAAEKSWREAVAARDCEPQLAAATQTLAQMASDFMMHHELGHLATSDERFSPFVRERVALFFEHHQPTDLTADWHGVLKDEAEADLFSINCCFASYAPSVSGSSLRTYMKFVAQAVTALNVLLGLSDDLYRLNVDVDFPINIDTHLSLWKHRENLMCAHIDSLPFGPETVQPVGADNLLPMPPAEALFETLHTTPLSDPFDEHQRRFVQLVDLGLTSEGAFEEVLSATRQQWILTRETPQT